MKFRGTLVVLVLALVLGGFVYFHEVRGGRQKAARRAKAESLLAIDAAHVAAIRVQHSGMNFDLEKKDGVWYLLRPVPAPADPRVMSAFLDTLAAARREDEVGRGDYVQYGLDAPAARVEIDVDGKTRKLAFGRINPLQTLVYVLVDDSKSVVLTTSALLTESLNNAFGWRDKRMIDVDPETLQRLHFTTIMNGEISIRRDPRFGWRTEGPVAWRVDPVRAQSLVQSLSQLDAVGVAAEKQGGSQAVRAREPLVDRRAADGRRPGRRRSHDWIRRQQGCLLRCRAHKPEIFRVDGKTVDRWIELAREPRDRKALPRFIPEKIDRIRVETSDDHFELRPPFGGGSGKWPRARRPTAPSPSRRAPVDAMLAELSKLEITDWPAQQPPAKLSIRPRSAFCCTRDPTPSRGSTSAARIRTASICSRAVPTSRRLFLLAPSALLQVPFDLERLKADEAPAPEGGDRG
jgi:hypothetical protein